MQKVQRKQKKRVCGVIPARYDSSRFPGKPLAQIAGKPMIQYVYERCRKSSLIDYLVVATDDTRIYSAVTRFGGNAVMTSQDHKSGTDRIAEAIQGIECEWVVNIQGDEPLIDPAVIDLLVNTMTGTAGVEMSTLITPVTNQSDLSNPNVVKVVCDKNGFALYFSRYPIPFVRDNTGGKWYKHIGIYGYARNFLLKLVQLPQSFLEQTEKLEQLRVLENGYRIKTVVTGYDGIGVDTPADLEEVKKRL